MVNELIVEKGKLQNKIQMKKAEILSLKHLISIQETSLLLNTDFKELGLTNEKQRTAYINDKLRTKKEEMDWLKYDLTILTDDVEIINDLLKEGE